MNAAALTAIVIAGMTAAAAASAGPEPPLSVVMTRAASYAEAFQRHLSGIVAEEIYRQKVAPLQRSVSNPWLQRELRSDLLLVRPVGADRYVEFRDVFGIDGLSVRDREERLTKLFLDPPPGAASQLKQVVEESARYNIGHITRTMNTPLLTATFLLPSYQGRFTFERKGREGTDVWLIQYKERTKPTLIRTPRGENLAAHGRFWINTATGAVTRTELLIEQRRFKAVVEVLYVTDPALGFLVPSEMREVYVASGEQRVEGHATYGRFRTFQVKVDEKIKAVKQ